MNGEEKALRISLPEDAEPLLSEILSFTWSPIEARVAEDGVTVTPIPVDVEQAVRELSLLCDNHQASIKFLDGIMEDMRKAIAEEENKRADWGYVIEELQEALCKEVGATEKAVDSKNTWAGLFCVSTFVLVATWACVLAGWLRI